MAGTKYTKATNLYGGYLRFLCSPKDKEFQIDNGFHVFRFDESQLKKLKKFIKDNNL